MRRLLPFLAVLFASALATAANAQQFTMKISSPTINDLTQEWAKEFKAGVDARAGGQSKSNFIRLASWGPFRRPSRAPRWARSKRLARRAGS